MWCLTDHLKMNALTWLTVSDLERRLNDYNVHVEQKAHDKLHNTEQIA